MTNDRLPAGVDRTRAYTAAEFAVLPRPACPTCGSAMSYGRIDVSDASDTVDRYIVGSVSCPRRCITEQ